MVVLTGFVMCGGNVCLGCLENCVGVLVICVLVFTVFCIVCTVFFVFFHDYFIFICFARTNVRTTATE